MTDTTKTEALEWADLAALGSIADHECADLEKFLRRIDADNAELKDSLFERALRIRTLEDERDRLAAECEALRADAERVTGLLSEARKIIRASSSRNLAKDWDLRTTKALARAKR